MTNSATLLTVIPELDNAAIRRTQDGRASVYDLIAVIGQQKNPHEAWKRLSERYPEVLTKCQNFQFPGRGQRKTPVTDREGWARIIDLLPGVRCYMANLLYSVMLSVAIASELVE